MLFLFLHSTIPPLSYFSDSAVLSEKSKRPLWLSETSGQIASDASAEPATGHAAAPVNVQSVRTVVTDSDFLGFFVGEGINEDEKKL